MWKKKEDKQECSTQKQKMKTNTVKWGSLILQNIEKATTLNTLDIATYLESQNLTLF